MKKLAIVTSVMAGAMFSVSATEATSIVNRDAKTHTMKVVEGEQNREIVLEPDQEIDEICSSDCSIQLGDDPEPYEVAATDKLSIEDGQLFIENSDEEEKLQEPSEQNIN